MLFDAHNHLQDARLAPHLSSIIETLQRLDLHGAVVNGTQENDWPAVAALAVKYPWVRASFGLHPWHVAQRSPHWLETLHGQLLADPRAGVGEIGLDRWIEGHDLEDQRGVFRAQLELAATLDRPPTIHCLQAWGALEETLREAPLPPRGFLLHAYGGPAEMVSGFLDRGAYFSFSPSFLHERKTAQREIFRQLPTSRLLVETDAPDLRPPFEQNLHPLEDVAGAPLNHPANLTVAYAGLAALREVSAPTLAESIAENFHRLFS